MDTQFSHALLSRTLHSKHLIKIIDITILFIYIYRVNHLFNSMWNLQYKSESEWNYIEFNFEIDSIIIRSFILFWFRIVGGGGAAVGFSVSLLFIWLRASFNSVVNFDLFCYCCCYWCSSSSFKFVCGSFEVLFFLFFEYSTICVLCSVWFVLIAFLTNFELFSFIFEKVIAQKEIYNYIYVSSMCIEWVQKKHVWIQH